MSPLFRAAVDIQKFVRDRGWPFCFIGGIVVSRWAVERQTVDADMTVFTRIERDGECIADLLGRFAPRHADAVAMAHRSRVLFLIHENGVALDVALGTMEFEERAIERATWWDCGNDVRLFTCSAEDLLVHKAYASRPQDWADVENVLAVQGTRLDVAQILRDLAPLTLLKEDDGIITKLEWMLKKQKLL